MNYSMDMNGWDLFNMPFSAPVKTAPQQKSAERPQQKPAAARRNNSTVQEQKTSPLSHQTTTQQKQPAAQNPKPAPQPITPAPVATGKAASVKEPSQASSPKPEQTAPTEVPAPLNKEESMPAPTKASSPKPEQAAPTKTTSVADTKPSAPQKELVLNLSSGSGAVPVQDDAAKRKAHEESEAKRKAEFDERQRVKKQAEEAALQKLNAMSDEDVIAASITRVRTYFERITRRNMKECVAAHIQELARKDSAFARRTMLPSKSIINCFKYINRMAKEYIQQDMKDNDIKPENGIYGGDVPDDVVYQFSVDYYRSDNLPEDQEKEEKFIPKPYTGASSKTAKPTKTAKKADKKSNKKQQNKTSGSYEQMSLEGVIG